MLWFLILCFHGFCFVCVSFAFPLLVFNSCLFSCFSEGGEREGVEIVVKKVGRNWGMGANHQNK